MMLKALARYTSGDPLPTGYAKKPIWFRLNIGWGGESCSLENLQKEQVVNDKPRLVVPELVIPMMNRTNNLKPNLAADTAEYVLGRAKPLSGKAAEDIEEVEKTVSAALKKHEKFVTLHEEWFTAAHEPDVGVYLQWVRNGRPGLDEAIANLKPPMVKKLDTTTLVISAEDENLASGKLFHRLDSAAEYWAAIQGKGGNRKVCIVCEKLKPVVSSLPQSLHGKLIPGTSNPTVALVSGNFASAQRGAKGKGLRSVPICSDCANAAVQGFNTLAASELHRWGRHDDPSATIWWLRTHDVAAESMLASLVDSEEAAKWVKRLHSSAVQGEPSYSTGHDLNRFYALTYSGNVSRLVIRDSLDMPLRDLERHLSLWFADTATLNEKSEWTPIWLLAQSLGRLPKGKDAADGVPQDAVSRLLRAALAGAALPISFAQRALERMRAESHDSQSDDGLVRFRVQQRDHARAAIIRMTLNRTLWKEKHMGQYLDENRDDSPYVGGRLFAVRQNLQYVAHRAQTESGKDVKINASIVDKFFNRAMSAPLSIDAQLVKLQEHHLKMLERSKRKGAAAQKGDSAARRALEERIAELTSKRGVPELRHDLESQAAWALGYYQQRYFDIQASKNHTKSKTDQN